MIQQLHRAARRKDLEVPRIQIQQIQMIHQVTMIQQIHRAARRKDLEVPRIQIQQILN
jgi:hypothetical protein